VRVVAIFPDAASAIESAVHRLRHADREALDTAHEPRRLVRFHEQVQMIGLDAECEHAEPARARRAQRVLKNRQEALVSERSNAGARPQGHMGRTARIVWEAPDMRDGAAALLGLAPGAIAPAAPRARPELELSHRTSHLEFGRNLAE
jgi:hypothetical protein